MDDKENEMKAASAAAQKRGRKPKRSVPDAAFDIWLRRHLHQMFDDVAREPIPQELLDLIGQDRRK